MATLGGQVASSVVLMSFKLRRGRREYTILSSSKRVIQGHHIAHSCIVLVVNDLNLGLFLELLASVLRVLKLHSLVIGSSARRTTPNLS